MGAKEQLSQQDSNICYYYYFFILDAIVTVYVEKEFNSQTQVKRRERNERKEILQGGEKKGKNKKMYKANFQHGKNLTVQCHRISADGRVDKYIYSLSGEVAEKAK